MPEPIICPCCESSSFAMRVECLIRFNTATNEIMQPQQGDTDLICTSCQKVFTPEEAAPFWKEPTFAALMLMHGKPDTEPGHFKEEPPVPGFSL